MRTYLWESSKTEEDFFSDLEKLTIEYDPLALFKVHAGVEHFFLKRKQNGFKMYREPSSSWRHMIWILKAKSESIPTGCRITAHLRPHALMFVLIGCWVFWGWIIGNGKMFLVIGLLLLFIIRGNPKRSLDIISQAAGVDFTEHFIGMLWFKKKRRKSEDDKAP